MADVRQRKAESEKAAAPMAAAASPAIELEPDWALVFARSDKDLRKHLAQALATLGDAGFYVSVQPGASNTVVLLLRAGPGLLTNTANRTIGAGRWVPVLEGVVDSYAVEPRAAPAVLSLSPLVPKAARDEIAAFYGGSTAALYDFSNALQSWLVLPAALGAGTYLFAGSYSLVYTVFVVLWGALFVAYWRNRVDPPAAARSDAPATSAVRTGFRGTSAAVRERRRLLFVPFAAGLLAVYAVGLLAVLAIEVFCTQLYDGPAKSVVALVPVGANIAASTVYGIVYKWALGKFVEWEDYASSEERSEVETQRAFYLNALLGYLPILLSAYVYLPFGNRILGVLPALHRSRAAAHVQLASQFELKTQRLVGQAVFYSVQNQIISVAVNAVLPLLIYVIKRFVLKKGAPGNNRGYVLQQLQPEFSVDGNASAMVLLFGYILLLAPVWPLAAVAGLVGVYVRSKGSLYLLTRGTRKPVNGRGRTLGFWNRDLTFLVLVASVVSPSIVVMFGTSTGVYSLDRSVVGVSPLVVVAVSFVSENLVLVFEYLAANYYTSVGAASPGLASKHARVPDTPEQDSAWRHIDAQAELARVVPGK